MYIYIYRVRRPPRASVTSCCCSRSRNGEPASATPGRIRSHTPVRRRATRRVCRRSRWGARATASAVRTASSKKGVWRQRARMALMSTCSRSCPRTCARKSKSRCVSDCYRKRRKHAIAHRHERGVRPRVTAGLNASLAGSSMLMRRGGRRGSRHRGRGGQVGLMGSGHRARNAAKSVARQALNVTC